MAEVIVGHGDIAEKVRELGVDTDGVIVFAAGVSDSACIDVEEFEREHELLRGQWPGRHLVYFSSLCVYYSTSLYAGHKYEMETVIRRHFPSHTIVRLGNISWGVNPHTLINALKTQILNGEDCRIDDAVRYVADEALFEQVIKRAVYGKPEEINVWRERLTVRQIYNRIRTGKL